MTNDPLAHPSGSLHFYAVFCGFFESPDAVRRPIAGLAPSPPTPPKAQIEANYTCVLETLQTLAEMLRPKPKP
jgi:hypothetical protein